MMRLSQAALPVLLLAFVAPAASGQSLGELAKKEQARRKAAPPATKTYTNDDLKGAPAPAGTAANATEKSGDADKAADAAKPGEAAKPGAKSGEAEKVDSTKPAEPAKDEQYWHGRISAAREDLRRNQAFREALQSRINALSADFASRDDPYQRAKIADDRQKALAEMTRLSEDIDKGAKLIADIEEEARRAGVPPGWIR
jgi:hypothetical protein